MARPWCSPRLAPLRVLTSAPIRRVAIARAAVLIHWETYVSDPRHIATRGATYLFDADGTALYEYKSRGVLTYSNTMARPLTFLAPYIGARALNALGLGDMSVAAETEGGTTGTAD